MVRIALSVIILLLDVTAIIGNAVVIIAFITNKKLRKPSGCYVTNLATADLLMSLFGIPFYVATVILDKWPYGEYFCALWTGMERVYSLVSNFAIVAICFDRFWLVTNSSLYLGTHSIKDAKCRIVIIWIIAILLRVPFVIFGMIHTWGELAPSSVCDPSSIYDIPFQIGIYEYDTIYTLLSTILEFCIPLVLIIIWGVQVYFYLEKREKKRLLKAVERSRAMSLDFSFSQKQLAHFRELEQRRGSSQSFLSRLFSPEQKNAAYAPANGKSRSQDTIAGPLSDLDEEPLGKAKVQRTASTGTEMDISLNKIKKAESQDLATSKISIILDPVPSIEETVPLTSSEDVKDSSSAIKIPEIVPLARISIEQLSVRSSRTSVQSLVQRRSASLNTLQLQSPSLMDNLDVMKDFPTSRSTPSIVLSCLCDHDVLLTPGVAYKDIVSSTPELKTDCSKCSVNQTKCFDYSKDTIPNVNIKPINSEQSETGSKLSKDASSSSSSTARGSVRERSSSLTVIGISGQKRFFRDGSATQTCDLLHVPSRSHHRLPQQEELTDSLANSTENSNSTANRDHRMNGHESRNSSFSSCASDLPESISSIITASEPPSPNGKRVSNADNCSAEFVQKVLNSKARQRYRSYRRRALMTILLMICVFVVFQLPYVVVTCIYSFCTSDCLSDIVYESANWWYWSKLFLNPFLYAHISPEFRRYSTAILRCKKTTHKKYGSSRKNWQDF